VGMNKKSFITCNAESAGSTGAELLGIGNYG
jgi:hypothetical protein